MTSGVTATHRETNPQIEYDLLLEEAWHINKAITEAQQKINDIHDAVPSLSKSLIENRLNNTEMEFYHRICNLDVGAGLKGSHFRRNRMPPPASRA